MPRSIDKPRKAFSLDEKLKRKRENLAKEVNTSEENLKLVNRFIDSQIMEGLSRQSCMTYLTSLRYVLQNSDIDFATATKEDVEKVLITLESWTAISGRNAGSPLSPFTKNTIKMQFKRFLQFIGLEEIAGVIKCKNLKGTKLPEDILTKDEVLLIIDHAGSTRDKALFGQLYESGCRAGEILSLKVKNIEFLDNGGCAITFPKGKTGPRRVLIFNFASYMRQWLDVHPLKDNPEAPLWPTSDYRFAPLSYIGLRYLLRETVKRTGIKKRVWIHGFRHSRATHLAEHLTEQQMKIYLGWSPGSDMPATYVHLSGKDMDRAIKKMYAIEDQEVPIDTMRPGICPRCHELNPSHARYCYKCGLVLTKEQNERDTKAFLEIMEEAKINPELLQKAVILGLQEMAR
jgi:integrase